LNAQRPGLEEGHGAKRKEHAANIAEIVTATRHDIFTEDALAWASFKTGRLEGARAASARALPHGDARPGPAGARG